MRRSPPRRASPPQGIKDITEPGASSPGLGHVGVAAKWKPSSGVPKRCPQEEIRQGHGPPRGPRPEHAAGERRSTRHRPCAWARHTRPILGGAVARLVCPSQSHGVTGSHRPQPRLARRHAGGPLSMTHTAVRPGAYAPRMLFSPGRAPSGESSLCPPCLPGQWNRAGQDAAGNVRGHSPGMFSAHRHLPRALPSGASCRARPDIV